MNPAFATAFITRAHSAVWCAAATVDSRGRPRNRVLHPIWEMVDGLPLGWIATGRHSLKARHLAQVPFISLTYMQDPLKPVYVECAAVWADERAAKERLWQLFSTTPAPVGYDPAPFFGSVDNPAFGALQLTPWRISLADLYGAEEVWKAPAG